MIKGEIVAIREIARDKCRMRLLLKNGDEKEYLLDGGAGLLMANYEAWKAYRTSNKGFTFQCDTSKNVFSGYLISTGLCGAYGVIREA